MHLPDPILSGNRRDFTIDSLALAVPETHLARGERELLGLVLPPWQRPEVWSAEQKVRFIEGIFLGFGTGYYVTNGFDWGHDAKRAPMSGWVLDGQQRISAIRDFITDKLPIFNGVVYSSIDIATKRRRFLREPFPRIELNYTTDEDTLRLLYDRLNFAGTAHTDDQRASNAEFAF